MLLLLLITPGRNRGKPNLPPFQGNISQEPLGARPKKNHARYPFLGSGSYQPPMLSVLYLQVGYLPVATGKVG